MKTKNSGYITNDWFTSENSREPSKDMRFFDKKMYFNGKHIASIGEHPYGGVNRIMYIPRFQKIIRAVINELGGGREGLDMMFDMLPYEQQTIINSKYLEKYPRLKMFIKKEV